MIQELFFPQVARSVYEKKETGAYYHYRHYHEVISSDCKRRCVYCDISLSENGHEGLHLDHFRPQDMFPGLKNDPNNLVTSCSKCNGKKLNHWPMSVSDPSHNDLFGFLDPFSCNRADFFSVQPDGNLFAIKGPAPYIIRLLDLNRASRRKVRFSRILRAKIDVLFLFCEKMTDELLAEVGNNISHEEIKSRLGEIIEVQRNLKELVSEIHEI
jgi:hypothetical protein